MRQIVLLLLIIAAPVYAAPTSAGSISSEEMEDLVAPIALYPDPLLGLMLPAAVFPDQIVDAALLIKTQSDAGLIAGQSWDESVKGVATYPGVLRMMYEKIDWTTKLGDAFLNQSDTLREAIQALRVKAQNVGNLRTTPEQQVSTKQVDGTTVIVIEPTKPEVIYVPQYTTEVVYTEPAPPASNYLAPLATFGLGMALGAAMSNSDNDDVYVYGGYPGRVMWYDHGDYNHWHDDRYDMLRDRQDFRQDSFENRQNFRQDAFKDQQDFRQDRRESQQNFRQDRIENGNYSGKNRTQTTNQEKKAKLQSQRASAADRGWGTGSKSSTARTTRSSSAKSSSTSSALQGYSSRASTSAMGSRGSKSRASSGLSQRSSGYSQRSSGGGARRGGGGGGRRR